MLHSSLRPVQKQNDLRSGEVDSITSTIDSVDGVVSNSGATSHISSVKVVAHSRLVTRLQHSHLLSSN